MPIVNASLMKWTNTKTERSFDEAIGDHGPANLDLNLGRRAWCSFQLCQPSANLDISAASTATGSMPSTSIVLSRTSGQGG
jgi:hypothetical protein